jgi:hypothetical protein
MRIPSSNLAKAARGFQRLWARTSLATSPTLEQALRYQPVEQLSTIASNVAE